MIRRVGVLAGIAVPLLLFPSGLASAAERVTPQPAPTTTPAATAPAAKAAAPAAEPKSGAAKLMTPRVPTATTRPTGPVRATLLPAAGQFVPMAGAPLLRARLAAGSATTFAAAGPGMPAPAEVSALAVSIETDRPAGDGELTIVRPGAAGERPTLRFARGSRSRAYDVITTPADGLLALTTSAATGVTVRLRGYYTSAKATTVGSTFVALPESPVRTDTPIRAGGSTTVTLAETAGLPAATDIAAVAVSLHVRAPAAGGCVSVRASGVDTGPSLCFRKGSDAVALDTVPVGPRGRVTVRSDSGVRLSIRVRGYHATPSAPVAGATFVAMDEPPLLSATVAPGRPAAVTMAKPAGVPDLGSVTALLVSTGHSGAGAAGCRTVTPAATRRADAGPTSCFGTGLSTGGVVLIRTDRSGRFRTSATAATMADARIKGYFRAAAAPAAPAAVKAVATHDGAMVSWTAPGTDSGAGVTGYTVRASPGGATARTSGATRATVGGLSAGTAYTFTVVATNAAGDSPASAPSNKATPSAAAAPLRVAGTGTDVTGSLTLDGPATSLAVPNDARAVYSFPGTAEQKIFTAVGVTQGDRGYARVELTSPSGTVLASKTYLRNSPGNSTNFDTLTLPATGTYKVTVTPDPGTVNTYQARVSSVPAAATGTTTVGGTAVPVTTVAAGQNASVSFPGTTGTAVVPRVHIDSPAGADSCVRATILDPNGNYVRSSDCVAQGWVGLGRADLTSTGTYTVVVDPSEAWTGTVSVSVLPVPADKAVAAALDGSRSSTTVTYGQAAAFSFTGAAGTTVHGLASLAGTDAEVLGYLYDAAGREVLNCFYCGGSFEYTLPATGSYTWRVVPLLDDVGSLGVTLDVVPPAVQVAGTIGGPAVRMASTAYWQDVVLSFEAAAAQRVYIACTPEGDARPSFLLRSATGSQLSMGTCTAGGVLFDQIFATAGTYRLQMTYSGRRTQAATVTLQGASAPAAVNATIGGPAVAVTTTAVGQVAEVRFTAAAGQRAYAECTQSLAGGETWRATVQMIDPAGGPTGWSDSCDGADPPTVQTFTFAAGAHTLRITPSGATTGTFTVRLRPVPAAVTATATMGGAPVSFTTTAIGQEALVRFTATAGQRLYVTCLQDVPRSPWGWTRYYLIDPSGNQVGNSEDCPNLNDLFTTRTLSAAGTYTIEVHPSSTSFGTARLQLYSVPPDAAATATIGGAAVSLATTTPGQEMRVSFNANAGDRVYLTCQQQKLTGKATESIWYALEDPSGEMPGIENLLDLMKVSGNCVDPLTTFDFRAPPTLFNTQVLAKTGTYTVTVNPENLVTGNTKIQIYRVPAESTATAVVGGPAVTTTTTAIGQEARVSFTAAPGQRLFIACSQRLVNNRGERPLFVLTGEQWQTSNCEREPALFDAQTFTTGGPMSIVIQPRGVATGTFTIRLYSPAPDVTKPATVGGGAVTTTTTDPGQHASITFQGTAGQRLYATCAQTMSGAAGKVPEYRLVAPDGATAGVADCSSPPVLFDTQVLTKSGTYRIDIAPPGVATGSYTVRLYSPPATVALTAAIDGPAVTATMAVPGQKAVVSFAGVAGQRVYVRCLEGLADLEDGFTNYVLSGPDGGQLAFGLCASPPTLFDTLTLPASGTYQISVAPPGIATGPVTLQLYAVPADVTQSAAIGGGPKTLTTTKVGQKAFLTFTASANQTLRVSCAETVTNGGDLVPFYELWDPSGTPIAFAECTDPANLFGTITLTAAGTHTIAIYPPGLATGAHTLQLFSS